MRKCISPNCDGRKRRVRKKRIIRVKYRKDIPPRYYCGNCRRNM